MAPNSNPQPNPNLEEGFDAYNRRSCKLHTSQISAVFLCPFRLVGLSHETAASRSSIQCVTGHRRIDVVVVSMWTAGAERWHGATVFARQAPVANNRLSCTVGAAT